MEKTASHCTHHFIIELPHCCYTNKTSGSCFFPKKGTFLRCQYILNIPNVCENTCQILEYYFIAHRLRFRRIALVLIIFAAVQFLYAEDWQYMMNMFLAPKWFIKQTNVTYEKYDRSRWQSVAYHRNLSAIWDLFWKPLTYWIVARGSTSPHSGCTNPQLKIGCSVGYPSYYEAL